MYMFIVVMAFTLAMLMFNVGHHSLDAHNLRAAAACFKLGWMSFVVGVLSLLTEVSRDHFRKQLRAPIRNPDRH